MLQNYSHKKSLEKIIPEHINHIKSMVVFSNRCNLKKVPFSNAEKILQKKDLKNELLKNQQDALSIIDMENNFLKLSKYSVHSQYQENLHIQEIQYLQRAN